MIEINYGQKKKFLIIIFCQIKQKSKKAAEQVPSLSANTFEFKSSHIADEEEEDLLLAAAANANAKTAANDNLHRLFQIHTKFLSADYEMVRMFGAKIVQSERNHGQKSNRNDSKFNFKNKIVNHKPTWPPFRKFGIWHVLKAFSRILL